MDSFGISLSGLDRCAPKLGQSVVHAMENDRDDEKQSQLHKFSDGDRNFECGLIGGCCGTIDHVLNRQYK